MAYYKKVADGYILSIGETNSDVRNPITESEYNEILTVIQNKPPRTETTDYRLKTDLTWEEYEHEPDPEPEPTAEEILEILLGGESE